MRVLKTALMLTLAVAISGGAMAAEEAKKPKGEKGARKAPAPTAQLLRDIELTDAQKEQVAAIDKEFGPKMAEIQKQQASILTEEQIKAQREVQANAKKAGTKPQDARKEVDAALNLSAEQKTKMEDVRKAQGELRGQMIVALKKVLTEEQAAKLPKTGGPGAKGKKPAGEKKPGAPKKKPADSK